MNMKKTKKYLALFLIVSMLFSNVPAYAATFEVDGVVFENFDVQPEA